MGKGDNYRPTDQPKYNERYDQIDWGDEQKAPVAEPDAFLTAEQLPLPFRRPRPKIRRNENG